MCLYSPWGSTQWIYRDGNVENTDSCLFYPDCFIHCTLQTAWPHFVLLVSIKFIPCPALSHFPDFCLQGFSAAHYHWTLFIPELPHFDKARLPVIAATSSLTVWGEAVLIWQLTCVQLSVFLLSGHKTLCYHTSLLFVAFYERASCSQILWYQVNTTICTPDVYLISNTTSRQKHLMSTSSW